MRSPCIATSVIQPVDLMSHNVLLYHCCTSVIMFIIKLDIISTVCASACYEQ